MKKSLILAACLLAAAVLPGCGELPAEPAVSTVPAAAETVPADREATLVVYLPDDDGMHVSPRSLKVTAKEKTLKNALFQMIQLDRQSAWPVLPTGLTVKDVNVKDGTAVIDLSDELKHLSGGTTAQTLFLAMFVNTATEFPNVKQVVFQMEGQPIASLGGHFDMTRPFKRDESLIRMEKK